MRIATRLWACLIAILALFSAEPTSAREFPLEAFPTRSPLEQQFRQAQILEAEGDPGAVAVYRQLLASDFAFQDAVHVALARLLPDLAEVHWKAVLDSEPASPFAVAALEGLAQLRESEGHFAEAETLLLRLARAAEEEEVASRALLRVLELRDRRGEGKQALAVAEKIWVEMAHLPESRLAAQYLARSTGDPFRPVRGERIFERGQLLIARGRRDEAVRTLAKLRGRLIPSSRIEPGVDLALGKALYFLRRYQEAVVALERARRHAGTEEEARYYRARSLFGLDRGDEGAVDLFALARKYPQSRKATTYLYQAFRVFEGREMWDEAKSARELLRKRYPASPLALESLWNDGWKAFRQGRAVQAAAAFHASMGASQRGWPRARGLYWEGRALLATGQPNAGRESLEQLIEEFPLGYYTRLARELVASGKPRLSLVDPRKGRSQPLRTVYPKIEDLPLDGAGGRAAGYLRLGLTEPAREVLGAKRRRGLAWARLAYWAEDFHGAVRAGGQSWLDWPQDGDPGPLSLPGLAYPIAYPRSADLAAREAGIHPHLLLAVAHTESHFDAKAYSPFEARGLMQFIPSTGSVVAKAAGIDGFAVEDLYQPRTALRLGARHLRELLDRFEGDPVAAIAAYNAGAGAVGRWRPGWNNQAPDVVVESIPYRETRRYVKKVITALDAYGRLDPPGLWVQQAP